MSGRTETASLATLIIAAILACVPTAALVGTRLVWADAPARVPTHWNVAGAVDGVLTSMNDFWISLLPAFACALIAVMVLVFVGTDVRPIVAALTFGALAAVAALFSLQWLVDVLTASRALHGGSDRMGSPFLLYLLGILWGMLVFGIVLLGRHPDRHGRGTDGTDDTDPADTMTT